eukprot:gene28084-31192_t
MLLEIALAVRGTNYIVLDQEKEDFFQYYDVENPTPWAVLLGSLALNNGTVG